MFSYENCQGVKTEKLPFKLTYASQEYLQNPEVLGRN